MAFNLQAIVGATTYELNNGNPFSFENGAGMGLASVLRYTERSPLQHGVSDLGYNLDTRIITLSLNFKAADDATLDGYRDDLNAIFKPTTDSAIKLRITRDDAAVRQIDTYATDNAIEIVREYRPGHLHKAVVQLRAADPVFYDPSPGTATMTLPDANWWLGANSIGSANVMEYQGTPTIGTAWTYMGTPDYTLTVVWRTSGSVPPGKSGTVPRYAWTTGTIDGSVVLGFASYPSTALYDWQTFQDDGTRFYNNNFASGGSITAGSVHSAYLLGTASSLGYSDQTFMRHDKDRSTELLNGFRFGGVSEIVGGGYWGGDGSGTATQWPGTITHAAIYDIKLSEAQIRGIAYSINSGTASNQDVALSYAGDIYEYPVITITGPVTNPVITNVTTSEILDFTGSTVPAGVTYTIDLTAGALSVTDNGGTVHTNKLSEDSTLGTWAIAPAPIATGGTNLITLTGTAIGTATAVSIVYYNRYMGY